NSYTLETMGEARARASESKAKYKQDSIRTIREEAKARIGDLTERDLLIFGLGLYLGEGSKTHDIVRISNSNPNVIKAVIEWFKMLEVRNEQFAARIHL